jgi:NADH:ubiquinone oxidoreductase subunit 6 (subunit J)
MMITEFIFYFFSAIACFSAAYILFANNILYAAFSLVLTFLSIAVMYIFAQAEFLAVSQIMIYVGGIVVLIIFGVMLTNRISERKIEHGSHNKFLGFVISTTLFTLLIYAIVAINFPSTSIPKEGNVKTIGIGLMSDYILPFELAAIILLIALIGSTVVVSKKMGGTNK